MATQLVLANAFPRVVIIHNTIYGASAKALTISCCGWPFCSLFFLPFREAKVSVEGQPNSCKGYGGERLSSPAETYGLEGFG